MCPFYPWVLFGSNPLITSFESLCPVEEIGCTPILLFRQFLAAETDLSFVEAVLGSIFYLLRPILPVRICRFHHESETKSPHIPSLGQGHQLPSSSTLLGRPYWEFHGRLWSTLVSELKGAFVRIRTARDLLELVHDL